VVRAAVAVLLLAAPAAAQTALPRAGHGTVGVLAGWRIVPDPGLVTDAAKIGRVVRPDLDGGFALAVPFTYYMTADTDIAIEAGFGTVRHRYGTPADAPLEAPGPGALDLTTFTLQITAHYTLGNWGPFAPYAGGGFGYFLNTATDAGRYVGELNATGLHLAAGTRVAMGGGFGLFVEDRYAFAWVPVSGVGTASVGGNTLWAGVYYGWQQEDDRGYDGGPRH
jgi:hypothetical protein